MSRSWYDLLGDRERVIAGVMSGTSHDGVDVAIVRLGAGVGRTRIELLARGYAAYGDPLRDALLALAGEGPPCAGGAAEAVSQLGVRLADEYARAIDATLREAGIARSTLDVIACHGQTVAHVPRGADCAGESTRSTLQLGDAATLAALLEVPVVSGFRAADMALGGEGAPLVPCFDHAVLCSEEESRLVLNLGGMANVTWLPRGAARDGVLAFDTGPGTVLVDALASRLLGARLDVGGKVAARGKAKPAILTALLADEYFHRSPPKSTGRDRFGAAFVDRFLALGAGLEAADLLATATALTATSVRLAVERYVAPLDDIGAVIVSGGGVRNATLWRHLERELSPARVVTSEAFGVDPDLKEAIAFAFLAHELLAGRPTNLPSVTGASRAARLGSITPPP